MGERAYLEEAALGRFLRERLDPDVVYDKVVPGAAGRYRPDYRSERYRLVIEFDGNQHYQRAAHVLRDGEKDKLFAAAGYRVVRIPYFVQLDAKVIDVLFGGLVRDRTPLKAFPHGFIASEVVFPADFCELGIERFRSDLNTFSCIAGEIWASLRAAAQRLGDRRLVCPPSLWGPLGS